MIKGLLILLSLVTQPHDTPQRSHDAALDCTGGTVTVSIVGTGGGADDLLPTKPDIQHSPSNPSLYPRVNLSGTDLMPMDQVRDIAASLPVHSDAPAGMRK